MTKYEVRIYFETKSDLVPSDTWLKISESEYNWLRKTGYINVYEVPKMNCLSFSEYQDEVSQLPNVKHIEYKALFKEYSLVGCYQVMKPLPDNVAVFLSTKYKWLKLIKGGLGE